MIQLCILDRQRSPRVQFADVNRLHRNDREESSILHRRRVSEAAGRYGLPRPRVRDSALAAGPE